MFQLKQLSFIKELILQHPHDCSSDINPQVAQVDEKKLSWKIPLQI
jgi:hypothetical protein